MIFLEVTLTPKEHKRIFSKIVSDSKTGCWNWNGSLDQMGYGLVWYKRKTERIHRILYSFFIKPIPKTRKMTIDHLCRNHKCCNPEHMELVHHRVNVIRGISPAAINYKKEFCKHGHPLKKGEHRKICRVCDQIRHKKRMSGPMREYWLSKQRENTKRYNMRHKLIISTGDQ